MLNTYDEQGKKIEIVLIAGVLSVNLDAAPDEGVLPHEDH